MLFPMNYEEDGMDNRSLDTSVRTPVTFAISESCLPDLS